MKPPPPGVAVKLAIPPEQADWSTPALAPDGAAFLVIVTVSFVGAHDPLLIVQTKVFAPMPSPVTPDAGLPGAVTEPLPAMTVHAPPPTAGKFPARVALAVQTD